MWRSLLSRLAFSFIAVGVVLVYTGWQDARAGAAPVFSWVVRLIGGVVLIAAGLFGLKLRATRHRPEQIRGDRPEQK